RREAPSGRVPILTCRARMVRGPMTPSGLEPTLRCRAMTDNGPRMPSGGVPTQCWVARVVSGPITLSTASLTVLTVLTLLTVLAGARVLDRDAGRQPEPVEVVAPLTRFSPARTLQTGHALGPWTTRTRWAV